MKTADGDGGVQTAEQRLRTKSTPLVRKIAAEHSVDITRIPGSGYAGRVTKQDILGYIERAPTRAPTHDAPRTTHVGAVDHPTVEPWPGDRVEPWSKIRKITADHMVMSRRVSAHVASFFEVDFTRVAQLRAKAKQTYAERGVNLTFLAFIVKACAENLRKHPIVNSAVSGDSTIYRGEVNIGIAVALDWGLIVPVIKHADELALMGIARAINDLGERARTKKLSPDDIQRGTFTITNPGGFGPFAGIHIINQPQVAILGVGAIEKRPKVLTAADGTESIAIRTMGMLTMSYDHRGVDGADADRFLADVKNLLQEFPEGAV
jgi:2-oxoglutarate dehydrogenase E2 component (dihydrolipoamide succinyltransferase)